MGRKVYRFPVRIVVFLGLVSSFLLYGAVGVQARTVSDLPGLCEDAARQVSAESGVPLDVLRAIALTESGRANGGTVRPWPWTVNMEGAGKWFESLPAALAFVDLHVSAGARSFDVGCFQINHRWHGHAFGSIREMFDPVANARYAANFLADLHRELGDWSLAAGAYHSRTPELAARYRARFDAIRVSLAPSAVPTTTAGLPPDDAQTPNGYPLMVSDASGQTLGSLVPLTGSGRALFAVE
ncbi:MAG: hypothetical protein CMH12_00860 [Maritimibacter sp.]|nr:hypothetical protein [Maritimibacter sp.]